MMTLDKEKEKDTKKSLFKTRHLLKIPNIRELVLSSQPTECFLSERYWNYGVPFNVKYFPHGTNALTYNYMGIFLVVPCFRSTSNFMIACNFTLKHNENQHHDCTKSFIYNFNHCGTIQDWGYQQFINLEDELLDETNGFIFPDGSIHIEIEIHNVDAENQHRHYLVPFLWSSLWEDESSYIYWIPEEVFEAITNSFPLCSFLLYERDKNPKTK
jgi:hypothetical protein